MVKKLKGGYNMEKLISILAILAALIAVVLAGVSLNKEVTVPTAEEIASKVVIPQVNVTVEQDAIVKEMAQDYLENKYDEKAQNNTAKDLVLSEKDKKSFKVEVLDLLNANGSSIESYKDLDIYSFVIDEVILSGDSAEVKVTLKVKSFNDGDLEDEVKARIKATFYVEDLVVDDEFEDSTIDQYTLTIDKIYN